MAKKFSFLIPLIIAGAFLPAIVRAQSFEAGIRNYRQHDYQQAVEIFDKLNAPQAHLFAGKSYYALGNYGKAEQVLNNLLHNSAGRIYYEAAYSSALVDFQQKQYPSALMKLYAVFRNVQSKSLADDANELYKQILNYLSVQQRMRAIKRIDAAQIKYQLVTSALGHADFSSIKKIIALFYDSTDKSKWVEKVRQLEESFSSEAAYNIEYGGKEYTATPPDGTVYNIGVLLPKSVQKKPVYSVIQGLYLGTRLATEQFNDRHSDVKVYLNFLPANSNDLDEVVKGFVKSKYGDIIIGPLFSEQAKEIIPLSVEYSIPIIAPLATSNLQSKGSLFYQANSTFAVHGKKMAAFAIKELGMNTFAIIAERNTSGAKSAKAFQKKAKALGANVVLFQLGKYKGRKKELAAYINKISSKLASVDALYAPFTSNYTSYLVEQLIYTINTFEDPVTLLGSPKWSQLNFSSDIYSRSAIYFSVNSFRNENLPSFQSQYGQLFGQNPNKYSVIGYDIAHYILQQLDKIGNPARLEEALKQTDRYKGLIKNIYFNGNHVNQAIQILQVSGQGYLDLQQWH